MRRNAFTIIEMMAVVVIVGILSSLAVLDFHKTVERNKAKAAEYHLKSIYNAQKRYKLDNGEYFVCSNTEGVVKEEEIGKALFPNSINADAYRNIGDTLFSYDIQATEDGGYTVTATRKSGMCAGRTVKITDAGGVPDKECPVWK